MPLIAFELAPSASKGDENLSKDAVTVPTVNEELIDVQKTYQHMRTEFGLPLVKLDVDRITDTTAGRLATSLLGHVLFLKNQVPFPVAQLERIPVGKTNPRSVKQRAQLLASFDTFSSHLVTTFSALSTAFAKLSKPDENELARAYLAILVGPSLGSAKSKVFLGIDGLEVKVWGTDDRLAEKGKICETYEEDNRSSDEEESEEESDENHELPEDSDDEDSEENEDDEDEDDDEGALSEPKAQDERISTSLPPSLNLSHLQQQKFLQNADRLLSRALTAADAEGNGISSELNPTQTHILIYAPRNFNHPAWIPQQNLTPSLNTSLEEFVKRSEMPFEDTPKPLSDSRGKLNRRNKVEGVWITDRMGPRRTFRKLSEKHLTIADENDDKIWWSWDGKLVGFDEW